MSTWNPSDKDAAITLSSGNTIATVNAATETGIRSTTANNAGRYYAEFTAQATASAAFGVGIASSLWSFTDANGIGGDVNSVGYAPATGDIYINNAVIGTASSGTTSNSVYCMAVDLNANTIWFRINGGNWNANAANSPDTNTGGFPMTGLTAGVGLFCAFGTVFTTTDSAQFNGGGSAFSQTKPATFAPWDFVFEFPKFFDLPLVNPEVVSY